MDKEKFFRVIAGVVAFVFFITSSAQAAPLASALRPASEFNTGRTSLADKLKTQAGPDNGGLLLENPHIELVPQAIPLAAKFAKRLLKYSRNKNAKEITKQIAEYIINEGDGNFIKALTGGKDLDKKSVDSVDKVAKEALEILAKMSHIGLFEEKIAEIILRNVNDSALAGNTLAKEWIKDYGTGMGLGMASFIATFRDEPVDLESLGVAPYFGIGIAVPVTRDLLLETVREVVKQELTRTYNIKQAEAEQLASGIVRSKADSTKAKSSSAGKIVRIGDFAFEVEDITAEALTSKGFLFDTVVRKNFPFAGLERLRNEARSIGYMSLNEDKIGRELLEGTGIRVNGCFRIPGPYDAYLLFLRPEKEGYADITLLISLKGRHDVEAYIANLTREQMERLKEALSYNKAAQELLQRNIALLVLNKLSVKSSSAGLDNYAEFTPILNIYDTDLDNEVKNQLWHLQTALGKLTGVRKKSEFIRLAIKDKKFKGETEDITLDKVISVIGCFQFSSEDEDMCLLLLEYDDTNRIIAVDLSGGFPSYYFIDKITNPRMFNRTVYREINPLASPESEIRVKWDRCIEELAGSAKSSSAGKVNVDRLFADLESPDPRIRKITVQELKAAYPELKSMIEAFYESLPVSGLNILSEIEKRKAPIPALNIDNGELSALQIPAFMKAQRETNAAIIYEVGPGAILTYADDRPQLPEYLAKTALEIKDARPYMFPYMPIYVCHLDHNQLTTIKVDKYITLSPQDRKKALYEEPIKRALKVLNDGSTSIALDLSTLMLLKEKDVNKRLEHVIEATAITLWFVAHLAKRLGIRVSIEIEVGDIGKEISTPEEATTLYEGVLMKFSEFASKAGMSDEIKDAYIEELLDRANIIFLAAQLGSSHGYDINDKDMLEPYEGGVITEQQYKEKKKGYVISRAEEIVEDFNNKLKRKILAAYHGYSGFPIKFVSKLINTGAGKVNINTDSQAEIWKVLQAWYPALYRELFDEAYNPAVEAKKKLEENLRKAEDTKDPEKIKKAQEALDKISKVVTAKSIEDANFKQDRENDFIKAKNRIIFGQEGAPGARKVFRGEKGMALLRKIADTLRDGTERKRIVKDDYYNIRLEVVDDAVFGLTPLEAIHKLAYERLIKLIKGLGLEGSADGCVVDRESELRLQRWQLAELRKKVEEIEAKTQATPKSSSAGKLTPTKVEKILKETVSEIEFVEGERMADYLPEYVEEVVIDNLPYKELAEEIHSVASGKEELVRKIIELITDDYISIRREVVTGFGVCKEVAKGKNPSVPSLDTRGTWALFTPEEWRQEKSRLGAIRFGYTDEGYDVRYKDVALVTKGKTRLWVRRNVQFMVLTLELPSKDVSRVVSEAAKEIAKSSSAGITVEVNKVPAIFKFLDIDQQDSVIPIFTGIDGLRSSDPRGRLLAAVGISYLDKETISQYKQYIIPIFTGTDGLRSIYPSDRLLAAVGMSHLDKETISQYKQDIISLSTDTDGLRSSDPRDRLWAAVGISHLDKETISQYKQDIISLLTGTDGLRSSNPWYRLWAAVGISYLDKETISQYKQDIISIFTGIDGLISSDPRYRLLAAVGISNLDKETISQYKQDIISIFTGTDGLRSRSPWYRLLAAVGMSYLDKETISQYKQDIIPIFTGTDGLRNSNPRYRLLAAIGLLSANKGETALIRVKINYPGLRTPHTILAEDTSALADKLQKEVFSSLKGISCRPLKDGKISLSYKIGIKPVIREKVDPADKGQFEKALSRVLTPAVFKPAAKSSSAGAVKRAKGDDLESVATILLNEALSKARLELLQKSRTKKLRVDSDIRWDEVLKAITTAATAKSEVAKIVEAISEHITVLSRKRCTGYATNHLLTDSGQIPTFDSKGWWFHTKDEWGDGVTHGNVFMQLTRFDSGPDAPDYTFVGYGAEGYTGCAMRNVQFTKVVIGLPESISISKIVSTAKSSSAGRISLEDFEKEIDAVKKFLAAKKLNEVRLSVNYDNKTLSLDFSFLAFSDVSGLEQLRSLMDLNLFQTEVSDEQIYEFLLNRSKGSRKVTVISNTGREIRKINDIPESARSYSTKSSSSGVYTELDRCIELNPIDLDRPKTSTISSRALRQELRRLRDYIVRDNMPIKEDKTESGYPEKIEGDFTDEAFVSYVFDTLQLKNIYIVAGPFSYNDENIYLLLVKEQVKGKLLNIIIALNGELVFHFQRARGRHPIYKPTGLGYYSVVITDKDGFNKAIESFLQECSRFEDDPTAKIQKETMISHTKILNKAIENQLTTKSSSAGKAMMELNKELRNAENILLDKLIAEIAQAPGEAELLNDSLLTGSLQALTELNTKATRLRGEQAITTDEEELIQLKIKAQRSVIEFARICAPIARIESEATIIVDPSVIPDERQRAAVVSMLKDNRLRSALEYALSLKDKGQITKKTQIVLLEDAGRISLDREKAILISDGQKLEDIKLFKVGAAKEDMLLPMAELIAIARGLLSLNNENFNQLFPAIKKMYEQYTGGNAIGAEIEKRLREGTWSIFELIITTLPGVEKLNQQEIERLQRQALAALIAA